MIDRLKKKYFFVSPHAFTIQNNQLTAFWFFFNAQYLFSRLSEHIVQVVFDQKCCFCQTLVVFRQVGGRIFEFTLKNVHKQSKTETKMYNRVRTYIILNESDAFIDFSQRLRKYVACHRNCWTLEDLQ